MHYYIYYIKDNQIFYERTCGTKKAAENRVEELKKTYPNAVYSNDVIIGAYR